MNKICLVTGASAGIGLATALELRGAGHTVYGAARRVSKMDALHEAGGHTLAMDARDSADLDRVADGVRVVIVQPGIIKTGFEDQTAAQLRQYSGHGAYRHMAEAMAREAATGLAGGSEPAVVAQAIRAAVESGHPQTRYAVGALAEQLLELNRTLPDQEFDKLATRAIR